jgi:release factor glutamine methyltransferase
MLAFKSQTITAKVALREGAMELQRAHIASASLDARLLLEHVLDIAREELLMRLDEPLPAQQYDAYRQLCTRRAARQPVAQLIGRREFWGTDFKVTPATLDPRPDSETLIEAVLARAADRSASLTILDLGTGTGCLLLTLLNALPNATGTGVDISSEALAVASENALRLGLQARTTFMASRWCDQVEGRFDIIVANPPYIPSNMIDTLAPEVARYEPRLALDGGEDGLDAYRAILEVLPDRLASGGVAAFEIGVGQQQALETMIADCGLQVAGVKRDLNDIPRCILMTI